MFFRYLLILIFIIPVNSLALIEVDAYDDRNFKGRVKEVAYASTVSSGGSQQQVTNFQVKIQMLDYRDVKSKYNSIASIEMIEAVGQIYLKNYFNTIKESLIDGGTAVIQSITINDNIYDRYKNKTDFIQKYIFPGGFLPSKNELVSLSNQSGLKFEQCSSYGDHYSNTLSIWRDEFFNKWDQISSQGFDNTFKRMWNFYLSYCEAGFKSKNIDLIQFALQK